MLSAAGVQVLLGGTVMQFNKTVGGDFDRIDISAGGSDEWLTIEMRVGWDVERVRMVLRSTEAVRDLHYALGRYLDTLDKRTK
jgi:hypothetical protein